jgi:hypothetical protein
MARLCGSSALRLATTRAGVLVYVAHLKGRGNIRMSTDAIMALTHTD